MGGSQAVMTAVDGGAFLDCLLAFGIGFATGVVIHFAAKGLAKISQKIASKFRPNTAVAKAVNPADDIIKNLNIDDDILTAASKGNPTFKTFRMRVWQEEAKKYPTKYSKQALSLMEKGKAPIVNGEKIILHHFEGRTLPGTLYKVVKLPESLHIAYHKQFTYNNPRLWSYEGLVNMLKNMRR